MAFNVAALTGWVNENSQTLLTQALLGSQTAQLVSVLPGVKYKQTLKYLETDSLIQAGGCGYTASGNTTLTDKEVTVVSMKVQETLCPADLDTTALQLSMRPGFNTSIPFEQQWAERKIKQLQTSVETMLWSATAASSTKCEGLVYTMNNDADVHDYTFNPCTTGRTSSDYINALFDMFNHLSPEAKSKTDLTLFVNYTTFSLMIQALIIGNLYHIDVTGNSGTSPFVFPGTNIKVVPIKALDSQCVMVLAPASNLIVVTDLLSEEDRVKYWWSEDNQEVRSTVDFKIGTSYYWGNEIVLAQ